MQQTAVPAWRRWLNRLAAGVFLVLAAACAYQLVAYPLDRMQGLYYSVLLVSAVPGFERAGACRYPIARSGTCLRRAALLMMRWVLAAALAIGTLYAVNAASHGHERSLAHNALQPLIQLLDDGKVIDAATAARTLAEKSAVRHIAIHRGAGMAMVELDAGSMDIDGSTIYFLWPQRTWQTFHQDADAERNAARRLYNETLGQALSHIDCDRQERIWQCRDGGADES
jgi:hypothetical protein